MNNDIYLIGEVGWDITLETVLEQIKQSDPNEPLNVHIHSVGGQVYDGLAIYNVFKALPQKVNTISSGLVASIASIIFLAGDRKTRVINRTDSFLIHLPSGGSFGNAEDLERTAEELRNIESKIADICAAETDLTVDEAMDLMKEDKMIDVDFLLEKGFVNEIIEFKAVAKFDKNKDMSEQLTKKELTSQLDTFWAKLKDFVNPKKETASTNKIVQDATGLEIEFINLSEADEVTTEQEARIDNAKASGDYVMPSGEIYKFENGILTTIEESKDESEELKNEITTLEGIVATLESDKVELETQNTNLESNFEILNNDFTALKKTVESNFNHDSKVDKPEESNKSESTSIFKEGREIK